MNTEQNNPLLTVFLLTYNHEDTVRDTFEGILKQRTKYPFVVKILEDCSTDGTLAICKEYRDKYPNIFILINQPQNTKGAHSRVALENEINTPYWTLIEGDDCHINPAFFEKALDFLEAHKDYNLYCADTIWSRPDRQNTSMEEANTSYKKIGHHITFHNYVYLHTSARVFRNIFNFKEFKGDFDIAWEANMNFLYIDKGKTYFEHEVVSLYRINGKGSWMSMKESEKFKANVNFYLNANRFFKDKYIDFFYHSSVKYFDPNMQKFKRIFGTKLAMRLFHFIYKKNIRCLIDEKYLKSLDEPAIFYCNKSEQSLFEKQINEINKFKRKYKKYKKISITLGIIVFVMTIMWLF